MEACPVPILARMLNTARSVPAILLSPFHLLAQVKGSWRTALLVVYGLLAVVIGTPLVRQRD